MSEILVSDVVERAARRLHWWAKSLPTDDPKTFWEDASKIERNHFRGLTHTAIEAIREPTESMVSAGASCDVMADFDEEGRCVGSAAKDVWRAMIGAALL